MKTVGASAAANRCAGETPWSKYFFSNEMHPAMDHQTGQSPRGGTGRRLAFDRRAASVEEQAGADLEPFGQLANVSLHQHDQRFQVQGLPPGQLGNGHQPVDNLQRVCVLHLVLDGLGRHHLDQLLGPEKTPVSFSGPVRSEDWQNGQAEDLGWWHTLRREGRPTKQGGDNRDTAFYRILVGYPG